MTAENGALLVISKNDIYAMPSERISMTVTTGQETVLYNDPVHVLLSIAPISRYDIRNEYLQLAVHLDSVVQTYKLVIVDSKRIHFYRRLLAQTALNVIGHETVCARLLEDAHTQRQIDICELAETLFPPFTTNGCFRALGNVRIQATFFASFLCSDSSRLIRFVLERSNVTCNVHYHDYAARFGFVTIALIGNGESMRLGAQARCAELVRLVGAVLLLTGNTTVPISWCTAPAVSEQSQ